MMNSYITNADRVLFLGAGASKPLGKMLMGEFIEHLKNIVDSRQYHFFYDIVAKEADLEFLLQELQEIEGKGYLDYKLSRTSGSEVITSPEGSKKNQLYSFQGSFDKLSQLATILRGLVEEQVFRHYRDFDNANAKNVTLLLDPLFRKVFSESSQPLVIFTTNYDPAVEQFCEQAALEPFLVDGFEHDSAKRQYVWSAQNFVFCPSEGVEQTIFLFKLHGSTDWLKKGTEIVKAGASVFAAGDNDNVNMMIYPAMRKVAYEEPFFTNYNYLQACLSHAKYCLFIGYSFRDYDALSRIRAAVTENRELRIEVLAPNAEELVNYLSKFEIQAKPIVSALGVGLPLPTLAV